MKKILAIAVLSALIAGCSGQCGMDRSKAMMGDKAHHAKEMMAGSKGRYELYPVTEKSVVGATGLEETTVFLLDKQTGKVWLYNNKFAAFIKVRYLDGVALPLSEDLKGEVEKYTSTFSPE